MIKNPSQQISRSLLLYNNSCSVNIVRNFLHHINLEVVFSIISTIRTIFSMQMFSQEKSDWCIILRNSIHTPFTYHQFPSTFHPLEYSIASIFYIMSTRKILQIWKILREHNKDFINYSHHSRHNLVYIKALVEMITRKIPIEILSKTQYMRKALLLYKKLCKKNNGSVPIAFRTAKYSERKEMQELISAKYFFIMTDFLFFSY